ncbi:phosphoribosylglycinamide formyltransferase [Nitrospira defluvii]|nr:phosphoribosylglycinamide formyltransferase [Nitrospira defluvii]
MSDRLVVGVFSSGRGSNLQAIIDAIEAGRLSARIAVVLSDKKDSQALERARKFKIKAIFIDPKPYENRESYDHACLEALKSCDVELVVLAGYMRILTTHLVAPYRGRMINIHPSLLPAFPGLHAQRQALSYGAKVSGCTVHFVDEEMDHGPIIAQAAVPLREGDTEAALSDRILKEEHRLLVEAIQYYAEGRLEIKDKTVLIDRQAFGTDPYTEVVK